MGQLRAFAALVSAARRRAAAAGAEVDFALVYIAEAHPTDGWMYPAVERFAYRKQHTRLDERVQAARTLRAKAAEADQALAGVPVLADAMSNAASLAFGALPERLAIVLDGEVRFIGGKGPDAYSVDDAGDALSALLEETRRARARDD